MIATDRFRFKTLLVVAALFMTIVLTGCSAKSNKGASGDGSGVGEFSDQDLALQNQERWGDGGTIPNAQAGGAFQDVYFAYDSSVVDSQYTGVIQSVASALRNDPSLQVEVEGHTDSRGTSEYNMALGERRAKSVARLLVDYGATSSQVTTVSYGEELPIAMGEDETSYSQNRRAHFALSRRGSGR